MCGLGVTPSVSTRVRNGPGVVRGPVRMSRRSKISATWSGRGGVEVVPDELLEEHPPGDRPVQHLGHGELRLPDRDVVAVARGPIDGGERVRQNRQPPAQQRLDLLGAQSLADPLQPGQVSGVVQGGEPVVQRGEPDPGLGGLAFGPLVAI